MLLVGHGRGVGGGHRLGYQRKKTGENSLFPARCTTCWKPGDVAAWPTAISSGWFDIALLGQRGVGMRCCAQHQKRATDFRTGQRLGSDDHLDARWHKPGRPKWMPIEQYAALPDELLLRELQVHAMRQRGFRSKTVVIVTTLVDAGDSGGRDRRISTVAAGRTELQLRSLRRSCCKWTICGVKTPLTAFVTEFYVCTCWPTT